MPDVSYIVVSYNTVDMTVRCLEHIYADVAPPDVEVIVVDNASKDATVATVQEKFPSVRVLANPDNRGFGTANNQGMAVACGRYYVLINTDAFVSPGFTAQFVTVMDRFPEVGIFGPRLLYEDGSRQQSCYRFPSPWRAVAEASGLLSVLARFAPFDDYRFWDHGETRAVDWVIGACMGIRPEVFRATGGFDEAFFMYGEEADWQRRFRQTGGRVQFVAEPSLIHLGGGSTRFDQHTEVNPVFFDSQDRYYLKHFGRGGLIVYRATMILGGLMRCGLWSLWMVVQPQRRKYWRDRIRFRWNLTVREVTVWPK